MLRPTVQSASPSSNKTPIWGLRPDLYYCQTVAGLLMWGALSDERTDLSFASAISVIRQSQVKVKVTLRLTVSQSVSLSVETVTVLSFWGALSNERTRLSFYMLLALARVVFLGSESRSTCDHILLSQI
jgi:hypothetical protein